MTKSGAEPNCPHLTYRKRIDNSVNSIKKRFTQLNIALQHIERDLRMKSPPDEAKSAGFQKEDRRMLRQIHRASVIGDRTTDRQIAKYTRREQVLYGVGFYKPPTKHDKGFSSYRAADKAIRAPQFHDAEGAYTTEDRDALAKAIVREYNFPKADSET